MLGTVTSVASAHGIHTALAYLDSSSMQQPPASMEGVL